MKGASGLPLPSPNPIPPSPKTFVFIESLFRKCTAHRDRGIAGSEGAVRREAHPLHFLSKGEILQAFSGKNPNKQQAPSLGDEAHWGTVSVRPFVAGSAGTCRRIKSLGRGGGAWGKGGSLSPERFLPSPKRESIAYSFFTSAYHALACSRSLVARLARACGSLM